MNNIPTDYEIIPYISKNFFCGNQEIAETIQEYCQDLSLSYLIDNIVNNTKSNASEKLLTFITERISFVPDLAKCNLKNLENLRKICLYIKSNSTLFNLANNFNENSIQTISELTLIRINFKDYIIEPELNPKSNNQSHLPIKMQKSPLTLALQTGKSQEAQKLIESMIEQNIAFNKAEFWQIRSFKNLDFKNEDFLALDLHVKNLIFRTANNFNNIPFVIRLNNLGMNVPGISVRGPNIISESMDIASVHRTISELLTQLRKDKRLLTKTEFKNQKKDCSWLRKGKFTRILGCDYVSRLSQKLNLKHIKVPEKKIIIEPEVQDTLSFQIHQDGTGLFHILSDDISIYAQKIKQSERLLSRDEIVELFAIIEASNFVDLWDHNFIVGDDGIYFIDTEFKSFSGNIQWDKMHRLSCYISEEDSSWFEQLINKKIEEEEKEIKEGHLLFHEAHCFLKCFKEKKIDVTSEDLDLVLQECKKLVKVCKLVGSNSLIRKLAISLHEIIKE